MPATKKNQRNYKVADLSPIQFRKQSHRWYQAVSQYWWNQGLAAWWIGPNLQPWITKGLGDFFLMFLHFVKFKGRMTVGDGRNPPPPKKMKGRQWPVYPGSWRKNTGDEIRNPTHKVGPEPSYKWSYKPYKWPYKWLTGVITLLIRVITPFITSRGPTLQLCREFSSMVISPKFANDGHFFEVHFTATK